MLANGGELFGHRLVSPASVKLMSSNQVGDLFATAGKKPAGMGFGYTVGVAEFGSGRESSRQWRLRLARRGRLSLMDRSRKRVGGRLSAGYTPGWFGV